MEQRRADATARPHMDNLGAGNPDTVSTVSSQPREKVEILNVHEVRRIEPAEPEKHFSARQDERRRHPATVLIRRAVRIGITSTSDPIAEKHTQRLFSQCWNAVTSLRGGTVDGHKSSPHNTRHSTARLVVAYRCDQRGDGSGLHPDILVGAHDEFSGRAIKSVIERGAVTDIRVEDMYGRSETRCNSSRTILGSVVDDDAAHAYSRTPRIRAERLSKKIGSVVTDGDDVDIGNRFRAPASGSSLIGCLRRSHEGYDPTPRAGLELPCQHDTPGSTAMSKSSPRRERLCQSAAHEASADHRLPGHEGPRRHRVVARWGR